jgi:uncharacterized delta-60 repeat protein
MKKIISSIIAMVIFSFPTVAQTIRSTDGSFGANGTSFVNFDDSTSLDREILAFQRDSKGNTYIFGNVAFVKTEFYERNASAMPFLAKVDSSGKTDSSFYEAGYRQITTGSLYAVDNLNPTIMRLNADESGIFLFRCYDTTFYAFKIKPEGRNDETYGYKGLKKHQFPFVTQTTRIQLKDVIACEDLGFIFVAVGGESTADRSFVYTFKIDKNGELDSSYGTGGFSNLNIPQKIDYGCARKISNNDFAISLINQTSSAGSTDSVRIFKLSLNGALDLSYSQRASRSILYSRYRQDDFNHSLITRLTLLNDSSLLFFATNRINAVLQFKFLKSGEPDLSFNGAPYSGTSISRSNSLDLFPNAPIDDRTLWLAEIGDYESLTSIIKIKITDEGFLDLDNRQSAKTSTLSGISIRQTLLTQIENGKLYGVSGYSPTGPVTYRLTNNILKDPTYNGKGFRNFDMFNSIEQLTSIFALPDGKLMGTAISINKHTPYATSDQPEYMFRLLADGQKDLSFGKNSTLQVRDSLAETAVRMDRKGRMLRFGNGNEPRSTWMSAFMIDRYTTEGFPDMTFGKSGRVIFQPFIHGYESSLPAWFDHFCLQADNSILVGGSINSPGYRYGVISILKLLENGQFDQSFGKKGVATIDLGADFDEPVGRHSGIDYMLPLKDQSLLIVIQDYDSRRYNAFRIDMLGNIIRSGGHNGKVELDGNFNYHRLKMLVQAPSGDIIYVMHNPLQSNSVIKMQRLNPLDLSSSPFLAFIDYPSTGCTYIDATSVVPLYSGGLIVTGVAKYRASDELESIKQVIVSLTKNGTIDSSFGVNGVMIVTPPVQGVTRTDPEDLDKLGYFYNGFQNSLAVRTADGNLVVGSSVINNRLKDLYLTKYTIDDPAGVEAPSALTIEAFPSDTVCNNEKVLLSVDSSKCVECTYVWSDGQTTPSIEVAQGGVYKVAAYNAAGDALAAKTITTITPAVPSFNVSFTGCPGSHLVFTATAAPTVPDAAFNWFVDDSLTHKGKVLELHARNGQLVQAVMEVPVTKCTVDSVLFGNIIKINCVQEDSIPETPRQSEALLSIAPNPASDKIIFTITNEVPGSYKVEVWNASGQRVTGMSMWFDAGTTSHSIPVSTFKPGLYYLNVHLAKQRLLKKVYIR